VVKFSVETVSASVRLSVYSSHSLCVSTVFCLCGILAGGS